MVAVVGITIDPDPIYTLTLKDSDMDRVHEEDNLIKYNKPAIVLR